MTIFNDNLEYDSDVYGCCNVFEKAKVAFECTPYNRDWISDEREVDSGLGVYFRVSNCKIHVCCEVSGLR